MDYDKKIVVKYVSKESFGNLGVVIQIPKKREMEPFLESSLFKHHSQLDFIKGEGDV